MVASDLERGKFFEYKGEICQVTRRNIVNCGTHSHTKLVFTVCDLYGKKERDITMGHNDKIEVLDIMKKKATVISKSGETIQILDSVTYETIDATAEKDVYDSLVEGDEIAYIEYKGVKVLGKKKN